jgi:uncharacterized protein YjdB
MKQKGGLFVVFFGLLSSILLLLSMPNIVMADTNTTVTYQAHVENIGWQTSVTSGQTAGTTGKGLRVEAFKINLINDSGKTGSLQYRAHVQNVGWQNWSTSGQEAGTTGKSLRVEALQIQLTGQLSQYFDVQYQVHVQNIGWQGWVKNGATAGTTGQSLRIEAIQIKIVPKQWWTIVNTTTYPKTNSANVKFYALKQNTRADGLYVDPWMTSANATVENHDAAKYHGTIVYADKEAVTKDSSGNNHNVVHVNVDGRWYWTDKGALSVEKNSDGSEEEPIFDYNSYNVNGQIIYKVDNSRFGSQIEAAANTWNTKLGKSVFVKASNSTPTSDINLKISDINLGTNGVLMSTSYGIGIMKVNIAYIGQTYTNNQVITAIFEHEMGHALGLNHTGSNNQSWSWSSPSDILWASTAPNSVQSISQQNIAAAKLVQSLKMYTNTAHPYTTNDGVSATHDPAVEVEAVLHTSEK